MGQNAGEKIAKLEKQCEINNEALTSFNREWTRFTVVTWDMVGHTFSVYDGSGFIPVKVTHSMIGKPLIMRDKLGLALSTTEKSNSSKGE